ncbi:hypothetical protein TcWFU_002519 [Taenia crassiceps]|uniref:Uncharacterized protein n=1 Tax=Taenia crassiceps TaxID=6207 RepID=A0ABR4QPL2_9CEST
MDDVNRLGFRGATNCISSKRPCLWLPPFPFAQSDRIYFISQKLLHSKEPDRNSLSRQFERKFALTLIVWYSTAEW